MATADETVSVEIGYALPDRQVLVPLTVPAGTTVGEAIRLSGVLDAFPEIDLARNKVGIFGRLCPLEREMQDGERAEIYRPLVADPKEVRRKLAQEGRTMGKKGA